MEVAELLLNDLQFDNLPLDARDAYKSCLRLAVHQTVEVAVTTRDMNLSSLVSELLDWIETLSVEHIDCKDLPFGASELDSFVDRLHLSPSNDGIDDDATRTLSAFEQQALQKRLVARIRSATTTDASTVDKMIRHWRRHAAGATPTQWQSLSQVVINYYLRVQKPAEATKWMQIREHIPRSEVDWADVLGATALTPEENEKSTTNSGHSVESEFQELSAVNQVFAADGQLRVQQKLNLLDVWANQVDSPIVPWRATEILESLEEEDSVMLGSGPYLTVLKLWLEHPFPDKVLNIAMRCPAMDPELILLQAKLLEQHGKSMADVSLISTHALYLVNAAEQRFGAFSSEEILSLSETLVQMISDPRGLFKHVEFLMDKGLIISPVITDRVFSKIDHETDSSLVHKFMGLLRDEIQPETFLHGIHWYLEQGEKANAQELLIRAISSVTREGSQPDSESTGQNVKRSPKILVAKLLNSFVRKATLKIEEVWDLLDDVEPVVLIPQTSTFRFSPIPFAFYLSILFQYKLNKEVDHYVTLMDRLNRHYQNGYVDLHPDEQMCRSFSALLGKEQGLASLDQRVKILKDLGERYKRCKELEEDGNNYKPSYIMFDWVIHDLKKRSTRYQHEGHDNPWELDSRTVVALLQLMHRLCITPDDLKRSYVFNIGIEMVTRCANRHMHFRTAMQLTKYMVDLGIEPNRITVENQLRACELASQGNNIKQAFWGWKMMINVLTEARRIENCSGDVKLYLACCRVMLANKHVQPHQKEKVKKMLSIVFQNCCADGALTFATRSAFLKLIPEDMKDEPHFLRLLNETIAIHSKSNNGTWTKSPQEKSLKMTIGKPEDGNS